MINNFLLLIILFIVIYLWQLFENRNGSTEKKRPLKKLSMPWLKLLNRPYASFLFLAVLMTMTGWAMQINDYGLKTVTDAISGGATINETMICRENLSKSKFSGSKVPRRLSCPYGGNVTLGSEDRIMCDKHGYADI